MTTLLEARKSDGTLLGRCDARCYDATSATCLCICGGRNHGVGLKQAAANSQRLLYPNPDAFNPPTPMSQVSLVKHPDLAALAGKGLLPGF